MEGQFADVLPAAQQVLQIALELGPRARQAGGTHDGRHAGRDVEVLHDRLEASSVFGVDDLPGDAAAANRVGHQHHVAAGEGQVGGQGRALVAALLLDHLHQHDLALLDDFLDVVAAAEQVTARLEAAALLIVHLVAAQVLDVAAGRRVHSVPVLCRGRAFRRGGVFERARIFRRSPVSRYVVGRDGRLRDAGFRRPGLLGVRLRPGLGRAAVGPRRGDGVPLLGRGLLLLVERLAVGDGDLVVVRVDFVEGEEAVAVATVIHEGCLERRLHAHHLGEIDVPFELLSRRRFEIEFL